MKCKRIISIVLAIACMMQLTACGSLLKDDMAVAIQNGQNLIIQVSNKDTAQTKVETDNIISWIPVGSSNTYTTSGFRSGVDRLFYINKVTTDEGNSKQGCMFTVASETGDAQSGNSTLRDAFRNKVFLEYLADGDVNSGLADIIEDAYMDVKSTDNSTTILNATLNAYFNLMIDEDNDPQYNGHRSLTREQFYTTLYKAGNPVIELEELTADDEFVKAVGGITPYTIFAKQLADKGWLTTANGGLNAETIKSEITKFEAIYLIVNTYFGDRLKSIVIDDNASAFGYEHNPELLNQLGIYNEEGNLVISNWKPNVMMYTLANPDNGMYTDMIAALGIAGQLGLLNGINTNMSTSITRNETMILLQNLYRAENSVYGYLTTTEYPNIVVKDTGNITEDTQEEIVENTDKSNLLDKFSPEQLEIFEGIKADVDSIIDVENIEKAKQDRTDELVYAYMLIEKLPENGKQLYDEWLQIINGDMANENDDKTEIVEDEAVNSEAEVVESEDTNKNEN